MKTTQKYLLFFLFFLVLVPVASQAQDKGDLDAVNRLLDRYRAAEDDNDMVAQGKLMTPDRIWVSQLSGMRRTDNVENMRIQQAQADRKKQLIPGLKQFTEDHDKIIKFYADGRVAIASFFRYVTRVFPPGTSEALTKEYAPSNELMSVVMEKRGVDWIIVHTHVSAPGIK